MCEWIDHLNGGREKQQLDIKSFEGINIGNKTVGQINHNYYCLSFSTSLMKETFIFHGVNITLQVRASPKGRDLFW
jgi:hypothetical protein